MCTAVTAVEHMQCIEKGVVSLCHCQRIPNGQAAFLVVPEKFLPAFFCSPFELIVQLRKIVKLNGKAHLKSWLPRRTLDVRILWQIFFSDSSSISKH